MYNTKAMMLKYKDKFANAHGKLHHKLTNSNNFAFVPVSQ